MSESTLRQGLVSAFRKAGVSAVAIEGASAGTPDVCWRDGWIELKALAGWPARAGTPVRIEHLTREQILWGIEWTQGGGQWHLLVKVGRREYFVFDIQGAVAVSRGLTRADWAEVAVYRGLALGEMMRFFQ